MIRTYLTFEDFIKSRSYGGNWPQLIEDGVPFMQGNKNFLEFIFTETGSVFKNSSPVKQEMSNDLFCTLICPRFKDMFIGYIDGEVDDEIKEEVFKDFRRKFLYTLNSSYDKYNKLISIYTAEKDHLMDDIKAVSESKFNDTPQEIQGGNYNWSSDDHLTNISRNETSAQVASKIARISEIDRLLKDYFDEWCKEFKGVFIYG